MNLPPELVRYVDVESVSETFVDSVGLNSCDGHIARIELCVTRLDQFDPKSPPSKPSAKKYPACRLVMPMDVCGGSGVFGALIADLCRSKFDTLRNPE